MSRTRFVFHTNEEIVSGLKEIEALLARKKIDRPTILRKRLLLEEIFARALECAEDAAVRATLRQLGSDISVKVMYRGVAFEPENRPEAELLRESAAAGLTGDEQDVVRSLLLRHFGKELSVSRRGSAVTVTVAIQSSEQKTLRNTLAAIGCGVLFGLLLRVISAPAAQWCADTLLSSFNTLFFNAIKIIAGPLVFLSLALGIGENGSIGRTGKAFLRLMGLFALCSALSMVISCGIFMLFPAGNPALQAMVADAAADTAADTSVLSLILSVVPASFPAPFTENQMLQILFLGAVSGLAIARSGESLTPLVGAFRTGERFVAEITAIFLKFMPISVFCAMGSLVISAELGSVLSVLGWLALHFATYAVMLAVLAVVLALLARESPLRFFKKYRGVMLNAIALDSSSAVMPVNMQVCRDKLGIPQKIYSLSIPLGMTVNMCGSIISTVITSLFMARVYGISFSATALLGLLPMIYIVTMSAPPVPGAALIIYSALLPIIGVPAGAVSIVMGLLAITGPWETMLNVTSTAVCSFVAAKRDGALNEELWRA